MKLNLGDGGIELPGYIGLDIKRGQKIYPLEYPNDSVEEIRASHVLEHFSHREVGAVVGDWVRALQPGGLLKIAVPDFEFIAKSYLAGEPVNVQGYVMGGHSDRHDMHHCVFDDESLTEVMRGANLVDITRWQGNPEDCSGLPVSLNLAGRKPLPDEVVKDDDSIEARCKKIGASLSMPRLSFTDNYFSVFASLVPLGIKLRKQTGAFWGQCLERSIDEWLAEGVEYVLTLDYDTVFTKDDVRELVRLSLEYPDADAIAPLQAHRTKQTPLMTIKGGDGMNVKQIHRDDFVPDLLRCHTAHFGLTLLKADKLREMARPLFWSRPDGDGRWGDGREDDDIYFWKRWEASGNSLYLANHITVGHAELMIRWPDVNLAAQYQHPSEFWKDGKPEWVWK